MLDYLICYLIPGKNNEINIVNLKKNLSNFFPPSLLPKKFIIIDHLPMLLNGKIDLSQLKKMSDHKEEINVAQLSPPTIEVVCDDLLNICRSLLNTETLSAAEDFYIQGMDSLSCLLLMTHIQQQYNIYFSLHEMLTHQTIDSLSQLIINKLDCNDRNLHNIVTPLKTSGHKTPLFLIHPIGGTVFWYNLMVRWFDPDRPVYAIQDPAIESPDYLFNNLEEMADSYWKCIQSIQPQGPYIIGGASFGATIAVEICNRLNKEDVTVIPILDGWAVYPQDLKDDNYFRESMQKQQADWREKFGIHHAPAFEKMFSIQQQRLELLYKYQMKDIIHDVALFKSQQIMDIFLPIDQADNHWGRYTKNNLAIISVEGNHESMFQNPQIKKLAKQLSLLLDKTEII